MKDFKWGLKFVLLLAVGAFIARLWIDRQESAKTVKA